MSSFIEKLTLISPDVNIMIINNARIDKNIIYVNNENINLFLPTIYKSWTTSQTSHIKIVKDNIINHVENNIYNISNIISICIIEFMSMIFTIVR